MPDETQATAREQQASSTMPHTWQKALEMWDAGEPVPAFHVETESATQEQLWGAAFDLLAGRLPDRGPFTDRENDVISSIVHVAKSVPWPKMVNTHVHATAPALMVRKPKSSDS